MFLKELQNRVQGQYLVVDITNCAYSPACLIAAKPAIFFEGGGKGCKGAAWESCSALAGAPENHIVSGQSASCSSIGSGSNYLDLPVQEALY